MAIISVHFVSHVPLNCKKIYWFKEKNGLFLSQIQNKASIKYSKLHMWDRNDELCGTMFSKKQLLYLSPLHRPLPQIAAFTLSFWLIIAVS